MLPQPGTKVTYHVRFPYGCTDGSLTEGQARAIQAKYDRDVPGRAPHTIFKRTVTITDEDLPEIE